MPKKIVRAVTTSTTLPSAQSATMGGIKIYQSGTFIPVEAYLDVNQTIIASQPINALSLSNAGFSGTSSVFLPPGTYRFVNFPPTWTGGPVGLTFEDPVVVT